MGIDKGKGIAMFSGLLIVIIFVIGIMNITSAGIPEIQQAGNNLNDTNLCIAASCFYNSSLTPACRQDNASNTSTTCATGQHTVQFSGFFGGQGILVLAIMAMIVIGLLGIVFLITKKK